MSFFLNVQEQYVNPDIKAKDYCLANSAYVCAGFRSITPDGKLTASGILVLTFILQVPIQKILQFLQANLLLQNHRILLLLSTIL
jgi:hypothetical protein